MKDKKIYLKTGVTSIGEGCKENGEVRFQHYVNPYMKQLQNKGAVVYNIGKFGQAVVLHPIK